MVFNILLNFRRVRGRVLFEPDPEGRGVGLGPHKAIAVHGVGGPMLSNAVGNRAGGDTPNAVGKGFPKGLPLAWR